MQGNTADVILSLLGEWGVKSVYGVSGDALFPLLDAFSRQDEIKYYGAASETGAAFMASYHAKLTGQPGVCIATSGPGLANLVNGLADAFFDRAPVLAITGQVETKKIGTKAKQYVNQQMILNSVTAKSELVVNAEAVVPAILAALERAVNERTVAHLSIPKDIFEMPAAKEWWPKVSGRSYIMGSGFGADLEEILGLLDGVHSPIILLGQRNQLTGNTVLALAEKLGAGVITAQQAKGVIPDSHSHVLGGIGQGYIPGILAKSDLILLIGDASFDMKFLPQGIPIVQLVDLPELLTFERINMGIVGNVNHILKLLVDRISLKPHRNKQWVDEIAREKSILLKALASIAANNSAPIHPARLVAAINSTVKADAIITSDVGSFMHWFDRGFQAEAQTVLLSSHWRSNGSGLPAAISAKIAAPGLQVVALVGDGGFLMAQGELLTAVKYNLPITVVVANSHEYTLERYKARAEGFASVGNTLKVPDFAALARACGAEGYRVVNPVELEPVMEKALNSNGPVVIDVEVASVPLPNLQ